MFLRATFFDRIQQRFLQANKSIVLPETDDPRVLSAIEKLLANHNTNRLALIGDRRKILSMANSYGINLDRPHHLSAIYWVSHEHPDLETEVQNAYREYFSKKGRSVEDAKAEMWAKSSIHQAAWLVGNGYVDCGLAGCSCPTADVIRATIIHVGLAENQSLISGAFIMVRESDDKNPIYYAYADCGVVVSPTSEQLKEIAYATSQTFQKIFRDEQVKIAFLSFSTQGSAKHKKQQSVARAYELFHESYPDMCAYGEIQFDAAIDQTISDAKCKESPLKGAANCFIFPDLNSGNIAYKITQRLGGFQAYGPLLQGTKRPFNDLSRGASAADIETAAKLSILQA